jgi:energy-coupling factor transporter ATP-binding protein EcfA2
MASSEFVFEAMEKEQSKLSVAVYGPSGSGKTTLLLKAAMGLRNVLYPGQSLHDIGLFIDTERRSSTKSVGRSIGGDVLEPLELYAFEPPFDIEKLWRLLDYAVNVKKKKIIVIDSYTAFWSGKDGILENVAELDVKLADAKKLYGAWSEREIVSKKNILKNLMTNSEAHILMGFRAKTEYVLETNARGKTVPRAIGVKEDMQSYVRYEFDCVLSIDKETHGVQIVKDRLGYSEIRMTAENPEAPFTVVDGEVLAKLVSEGLSLEEVAQRKQEKLVKFVLDEKAHRSSRVTAFETSKEIELTESYVRSLSYDMLTKLVKYLKG